MSDKLNGGNRPRPGEEQPQIDAGMLDDDDFRLKIGLCCSNCAFSRPALDSNGEATGMILCRNRPPTVVGSHPLVSTRDQLSGADMGGERIRPFTMWPTMDQSEWCGRYTAPDEWLMILGHRFGQFEEAQPDGGAANE